ncbi:MAG: efflux RND transporter permease subunit [Bacteroidota bacterium]
MTLYTLSIRRPVLATVFSLVIVLGGTLAYFNLGVREYPAVDPPIISVSTSYRGANAEVIAAQITEPLEERINGVEGIRALTSISRDGRSTITVEFALGADLERAANDVRDRVSQAVGALPPDADPPRVSKADADGDPIVFLNIASDERDLLELSAIAEDLFKERLQTIAGVARVDIWGDKRYAMRLWLDPAKLAAYQLTPLDVQRALTTQNVELPTGRIEGDNVELTVRMMGQVQTPEGFEALIVKRTGDQLVRLGDVGRAELGAENERTVLKRDGTPMVGVVLRPLPGANYIAIVDEFYARVETIRPDLPPDLRLGIGFDQTTQIRDSVAEVRQTIFLALALVLLVIFLFLRDWRSTVVPVVVIPIALIGAFGVMALFGFSINVLTLLALVLAIGLVVDDAIVVLENIYAKIEEGYDPIQAGIRGTKEIFFAVVATTLALVSVLLPIVFLPGLTGRLFREFGLVLMGAVVISSFVALTLTPMLATKLLKKRDVQPWFYRKTEPFFERLTEGYRSLLDGFVARRWAAPVTMAIALGLTVLFFQTLPSELAPLEDRSNLRAFAVAPEGATFEYMERYVGDLIDVVEREVPEVDALITVTSPGFGGGSSVNSAFARIRLVPPSERERSQQEIASALSSAVRSLPAARTFISQEQTISAGRGGGQPVQYVLQAPNLAKLEAVLPAFMERAQQDPAFAFVDVNLKFTKPELRVEIDRARAEKVGVSVLDVAQTLQYALSESRLGYFVANGQQYQVIAQVDRADRDETVDLTSLSVRASNGDPVPLDGLVTVREASTPPQLFRTDRFLSATVSASLADGVPLADGLAAMDAIAADVLDASFSTTLAGQSRDLAESAGGIAFVFVLALLLIYLVLAAQFESFRDPFTILLTVPLALAGALLALWYFNQSLNLFSQIGLVMLIGLVTKNAILIVEFANQRRAAGRTIHEAALDAAAARFRPILMTAASTALGTLPIALALGAGAESRMPMGIAIIGGLLIGTALTLFVIPAVYPALTRKTLAPAIEEAALLSPNESGGPAGDGLDTPTPDLAATESSR